MRFWTSMVFSPMEHYVPVAEALDDLAYEGMLLADHLVSVREPVSRYPYAPDGRAPWVDGAHFPDTWVTVAALAARTRRLRFASSVYIVPARDVFSLAKQVGTVATLAPGRVTLGMGVGWMREEYLLTGRSFEDRGRRLDEMIEVMRLLWSGEWVDYHGRFHDFAGLRMLPAPASAVPMWGGGYTPPALRRAAVLCDGWVGVLPDADRAASIVSTLTGLLDEYGRADADFRIVASVPGMTSPDAVDGWAALGVTDVIVQPWAASPPGDSTRRQSGGATDLPTVIRSLESFAARMGPVLRSA